MRGSARSSDLTSTNRLRSSVPARGQALFRGESAPYLARHRLPLSKASARPLPLARLPRTLFVFRLANVLRLGHFLGSLVWNAPTSLFYILFMRLLPLFLHRLTCVGMSLARDAMLGLVPSLACDLTAVPGQPFASRLPSAPGIAARARRIYMIGGFFDRHHAAWGEAEIAWFEALLDEDDVDVMAWALGAQPAPERFRGDAARGPAKARLRHHLGCGSQRPSA